MVTLVACNMCGKKMDVAKNGAVAQIGESYFNGDAYKCPTCEMSVFVTDTQGSTEPEPIDLIIQAKMIVGLTQLADRLDAKGFIKEANVIDDIVHKVRNKVKNLLPKGKELPPSKVVEYLVSSEEIAEIKKLVEANNDSKLASFINEMIHLRILKYTFSLGFI